MSADVPPPRVPAAGAPSPEGAPGRHRPPWLASLTLVLLPAALLLLGAWATVHWLGNTTAGLRAVLWAATWAMPSLRTSGVDGSLVSGFTMERVSIDEPRYSVVATGVAVVPAHIGWTDRALDLAQVSARSVAVAWTPGEAKKTPNPPPASLALPLSLRVRELSVRELRIGERDREPQVIREVRLRGGADRESIRIERGSARYGSTEASIEARMGARRPFPLSARAEVRSVLLDRPVQADVAADGTLLDMTLTTRSDNAAGRFDATARVTPFEAVPLAALSVRIADLEPGAWVKDLPAMRLAGSAQLQPQAGDTFTLAGPFQATNAMAGPLDRQRVPLQSARGRLRWSADRLELWIDRAEGGGGSARGEATRLADGALVARLGFEALDAALIHTQAVSTRVSGQLDYRLDGGRQRFAGRATNAKGIPLDAEFTLSLADSVLQVEKASARLGEGRADIGGRVQFGKQVAAQLRAEFHALDLSRVVAGVDTRLNGRVLVDGTLQPVRRGRAELTLGDSRLYGRPVAGRAALQIDGDRFEVDTELVSGAAHLRASGGLGGGRELTFEFVAPKIDELFAPVAGSMTAQGTIAGTMEAPSLAVTASAGSLLLPNQHRIEKLEASVRGGAAADAPLDVTITLSGHSAPSRPELSLATASLTARGTTARHEIALDATSTAKEPLALRAGGGWREGAWRGTVASITVGKPFELRLDSAAPVLIGSDRVEVGPAQLVARGTRFGEVQFTRSDGRWRSAGTFAQLQPQVLDPRARAPRRAVRTTAADPQPLTLAGRWNLEYDATLSGILVIERSGGDLYGGVDAVHPIGISDIGAALSIVENRLTGTAYLRGRALGQVDAVIDAFVDPENLRLAQDRSFRVAVDANLPDLGWLGPLMSDTVQVQGAATVHAVVGGTPRDPTADGQVRGRDLRLTWIEQGLRLENGTLNADLEDGVLVLNEMTFTGEARTAPADKRALGALTVGQSGTLKVVGRLALQTLTGSIGVTAKQLPILQRLDRWMVVSGDGGITLTPTRAELYAKATADGAYFDFSSLRGPASLPSDVVVVRPERQRRARESTAPVDVTLNVEGRLGPRFYIRGAGLEARLAGGVAVTGRPTQLQATGTVRIVDGVYNGYGQRLQIQRGLVTFSGPLENPALNVLAVRTGLPVEVGVQITGTALAPNVRLHSDVAMSDVEKLNWLVLGRPPGTGEGQDRALLTAAASALFAGQMDGAGSNLMRALGLDEFGIRAGGQSSSSLLPRESVAGTLRSGSSSTAAGDFVALGKRINEDLYVTFEQALSGAATYVALNYQLTRRLSIIARAGSTNALDLVYSLAFD